jgi:hypothetical protein
VSRLDDHDDELDGELDEIPLDDDELDEIAAAELAGLHPAEWSHGRSRLRGRPIEDGPGLPDPPVDP